MRNDAESAGIREVTTLPTSASILTGTKFIVQSDKNFASMGDAHSGIASQGVVRDVVPFSRKFSDLGPIVCQDRNRVFKFGRC